MNDTRDIDGLTGREIAVIGMAGRFPGARNLKEFRRNLREGVESVTFLNDEELLAAGVSPDHLRHPHYVKAASLLDDVELFDASFFGYTAREAEILDPQQRLFLEDAWHALEDAGYAPMEYEGLIGVYAGAAWNTYLLSHLTTHPELFEAGGAFQVFIASDKDFMPTRVAYKFNLKGPGVIIQTSCSTSLTAVHLACLSLLNYECDIALAGGVTVKVPQSAGYFHQEGGLASPDGHCRPFDADAAGTIFGSGVGVVVLKRLSEALDDGDNIRAIIKASAINNDGSAKVSYTAPSVEGQAQVINSALAMAGIEPETIRYIETHGTGTSLGDPVEITALTKVFRRQTTSNEFCAVGSVKSNVGHLDAAAGIAGLIKTVFALENKELHPSLNFQRPNPSINFAETPFYVNSRYAAWENQGIPRRAAVSSFGVGGTNAHVILEEAPPRAPSGQSRPQQLLVVSAKTASALESSIENLLSELREDKGLSLPDIAYTLQIGRTVFRHRCALVCRDREDAVRALETSNSSRLMTATDTQEPRDRPIVFMFPGQGSQYLRMAQEIYEREAAFRNQFDDCAIRLKPVLGVDIRSVIYPEGDVDEAHQAAEIEQTALAQPILFAFEYALAALWMEWGVKPAAMIGHSIGEYVAACLAGVISLEDALKLVAVRGKLMQRQPQGKMLAVLLPEEDLRPLLPSGISLAAVNEPSSVVISGSSEAMAKFEDELAGRNIDFRRLHTSHAFHSAMMEPILGAFTQQLRQIRLSPPRMPFISNLTGTWITAEQATDPNYWARHLRETVRFSEGLTELFSDPDRILLEVGPGRVLTTLATRHQGNRVSLPSIRHPKEEGSDTARILESLGRLWLAGVKVDWDEFYRNENRLRLQLPGYPFERRRFWIEPKARSTKESDAGAFDTATGKKANLSDWFYLPSWKPAPLPSSKGEPGDPWLILSEGDGPGEALADHLARQGREVVMVEPGAGFRRLAEKRYAIRHDSGADYQSLLDELRESASLPRTIVHAFSLMGKTLNVSTAEAFEAFQERGFYSLLHLLQAAAQYPQNHFKVIALSNRALATMSEEPLLAEKAPMLGLCRVAAQELPNIASQFIDVMPVDPDSFFGAARMFDSLISEMESTAPEPAVAYRGGRRWVPSFEPVHQDGDGNTAPLREHGTYLITGGMTGNGFRLAEYLARTVKAKLVLVEDARKSAAGLVHSIESLERSGAEAWFVEADLTDSERLRRVWTEAESRFGPIRGVIHAAGPAGEDAFRAVSEATREDCERFFRPKAHALYALESVLKEKQLDFCVLLSSLASVTGGIGFGPYSAADLFMDSFVARANRTGRTPWLSLNMDLWLSERNQDRMIEIRSDLSERAMTAQEGEEAFRRALLLSCVDRVFVSTTDLSAVISSMRQRLDLLYAHREAKAAPEAETALHPRPPLPNPYVAPETDLERQITAVWRRVLGFEQIGVDDNFFDLGGDSLIAIRMASELKQELRMEFPVAKIYQGVTVRALAQLLEQGEDQERQRRAAQLAEHKQTNDRRRKYIERRTSLMREKEG